MRFSKQVLDIDAARMADRLTEAIRTRIHKQLRREGAVVGISGGIDSSVVATLCARALGPERVLGICMPEMESSPRSQKLAASLAENLGIGFEVHDITPVLEGSACYRRRDAAIRRVFTDLPEDYKAKITIAHNPLERDGLNFFKLTVEMPDGESRSRRMPVGEYLEIVAASNLKQRTRMMTLYYHAECLNRAVVGTCNKDEHALGFFVKYGDGGADLYPIADLFKVQVYALARQLGIPAEIIDRVPTTDTYSAEVTQTEFFFGVDFETLDLLWWAMENNVPISEAGSALGLTAEQVERVYRDIAQKQRNTAYLRRGRLVGLDGRDS